MIKLCRLKREEVYPMTKPIVAIVGKPNVGKSTIFNRVVGERVSIVEDTPGVTRDRIYSSGEWLTHEFNIIDTGGIEIGDAPFQTQIRAQAEIAIEEADVIILWSMLEKDLHKVMKWSHKCFINLRNLLY